MEGEVQMIVRHENNELWTEDDEGNKLSPVFNTKTWEIVEGDTFLEDNNLTNWRTFNETD